MQDYLSFRKMITPVFIQVIFWVIVAVIVIAALAQFADGRALSGLLTLIFGPLIARIYAEIFLVIFRIHDDVASIRQDRASGASPASPVAPPPAQA
jgi:hypothetical protein